MAATRFRRAHATAAVTAAGAEAVAPTLPRDDAAVARAVLRTEGGRFGRAGGPPASGPPACGMSWGPGAVAVTAGVGEHAVGGLTHYFSVWTRDSGVSRA